MSTISKTRGIVLHQQKYGETSIIARIYTEKLGLQSYIIKGVRSPKSKTKNNLFQPGNILDMVVYYKEKSSLRNIKEVKSEYLYKTIPFEMIKSSIMLFMIEILYKTIYEEESNPELFDFVYDSLVTLDQKEKELHDFHLVFMIRLSKYLGFHPRSDYWGKMLFFDLQEGIFSDSRPFHDHYLAKDMALLLFQLIKSSENQTIPFSIPPSKRKLLLEKLIEYYRLHLPMISEIKSHLVLSEVLSN
jgi:DNA repair protein RecO (recombination protein O)